MSKMIWGVGCLVLLAGSAAGANWYADQQLRAYYEKSSAVNSTQDIDIIYKNFNMSALGGGADWTLNLALDPCKPKEKLVLNGRDTIQKKWNGYHIDSAFQLKSGTPEAMKIWRGQHHAFTHISWLGQSALQINVPRIENDSNGMHVRIDPSIFMVHGSAARNDDKIDKVSFTMPVITMSFGPSQMMAQDVLLETTQGLNGAQIEPGMSRFKMGSFQRLDSSLTGGLKNMELLVETKVDDSKAAVESSLKVGEMKVPNSPLIKDVVMSLNMQNINLQHLQAFADVIEKSNKSCQASEQMRENTSEALLKLMNDGFDFKSENQLGMGDGIATANLDGRMMPGHHVSMQTFVEMLPKLLTFKADLSFDKNIFKAVTNGYSQAASQKTPSDHDIETAFSALESSGQAKRSGDKMTMLVDYQFGQKMIVKPNN